VVLFDFVNGRAQSLFLLRREVSNVSLRVGLEEVDEAWLQKQQVDHPRSSALAPAFGRPAHFAQAAETGDEVACFGPNGKELLESRIIGVRPQVRALLGEGRRLNEGQHALLLSIIFFAGRKGNRFGHATWAAVASGGTERRQATGDRGQSGDEWLVASDEG